MVQATPEPRTAVLILVEASWEDSAGVPQIASAWVENKSPGGACIRIKTEIPTGVKLTIQGRWEQITGTCKYCRHTGKYYLVGVQRDPANQSEARRADPVTIVHQAMPTEPKRDNVPAPEMPTLASIVVARRLEQRANGDDRAHNPSFHGPDSLRRVISNSKPPLREEEIERDSGKERNPMQRKWSELMHRHEREDDALEIHSPSSNGKIDSARDEAAASPVELGALQVELLPMEDIYRAAGIANPHKGYSIAKVVEMLNSEYVRGLSRELKRAAVLMALDAAGVPVQQVLLDAKARQEALYSYEAEQKKEVEAQWERRAEENVQIQAELERVKAHYMTRIRRNMDSVAREKAVFNAWLTTKQQESQSIGEAAELCIKAAAPEPADRALSAAAEATDGARPV